MKKALLFLGIVALMTAGCSRTWSGIKQDTGEVIDDTREVIHEATAPSYAPVTDSTKTTLDPLPKIEAPEEVNTIAK